MTFTEFIISFAVLIPVSSLAILGWYVVTRGYWEMLPDGKYIKQGKIFKEWSLFFEQYRKEKKVYFANESLGEKYELLQNKLTVVCSKISYNTLCSYFLIKEKLSESGISLIKDITLCELSIEGDKLYLYKNYPVYLFPSWVRYPLSSCPACMASVYGSIIYWTCASLNNSFYDWANSFATCRIFFWVIFCLSVSCMNYIIDSKYNL